MKSVGRRRRRQAGGRPGSSLLAVSVPPACLALKASLLFCPVPPGLVFPSWLLTHPPLPTLPPTPRSPHLAWSAFFSCRLPSFCLSLPVLSPTCPLNFISESDTLDLLSSHPARLSGPPRAVLMWNITDGPQGERCEAGGPAQQVRDA